MSEDTPAGPASPALSKYRFPGALHSGGVLPGQARDCELLYTSPPRDPPETLARSRRLGTLPSWAHTCAVCAPSSGLEQTSPLGPCGWGPAAGTCRVSNTQRTPTLKFPQGSSDGFATLGAHLDLLPGRVLGLASPQGSQICLSRRHCGQPSGLLGQAGHSLCRRWNIVPG